MSPIASEVRNSCQNSIVERDGIRITLPSVTDSILSLLILLFFSFSYMHSMRRFVFGTNQNIATLSGIILLLSGLLFIIGRNYKLRYYDLIWILIYACSLYHNGDLQRGSFSNSLFFLIGIVVPFFVRNYHFEKQVIAAVYFFSSIHLCFGLYYMRHKGLLISRLSTYFNLNSIGYDMLRRMISSGYMTGLTDHYSTSGMYMAFASIAAYTVYLYVRVIHKSRFTVILSLFSFLAFFMGLILTAKRAHLIFTAMVIAILYLTAYTYGGLKQRLKRIINLLILVGCAFLLVANIPAFSATVDRFIHGSLYDSSRVNYLWKPALAEIRNNRLTGIGWRQFYYHYGFSNRAADAHNIYIQLLVECGVYVGVLIISFLFYNASMTFRLMMLRREKRLFDEDYLYLMLSMSFQLFFLMYGLTGNPLYSIQCLYPYIMACSISYKEYASWGGKMLDQKKRLRVRIVRRHGAEMS